MIGNVYFTDGHVEEVTKCIKYSDDEVAFNTMSGSYYFRCYREYLGVNDTWYRDHEFLVYKGQWLRTLGIESLELYYEEDEDA